MAGNQCKPLPREIHQGDIDRFWSRVEKLGPDECWPWMGRRNAAGYGYFTIKANGINRNVGVHRFSLGIATGGIRLDKLACHTCDHPWCCNDAHLFWGNTKENAEDMAAKGRAPRASAKVSPQDVCDIRALYAQGVRNVDLARTYGMTHTAIIKIVRRQRWKHVV